jgi:hypothetical protein
LAVLLSIDTLKTCVVLDAMTGSRHDSNKELIGQGRIGIKPFDGHSVQPSSVDLRLDFRFRVFRSTRHSHIDPRVDQADLTELVTLGPDEPFVLQPGQFCLGNTLEQISLPDDIVGRLDAARKLQRWFRARRAQARARGHNVNKMWIEQKASELKLEYDLSKSG